MLVSNILHSCSNERVAEAAVASIGGDFSLRVRGLAARCDMPVGVLTGRLVRRFAHHAGEQDWRHVADAMAGHDLPILRGLEAIVDRMLENPSTGVHLTDLASDSGDAPRVWSIRPDMRAGLLKGD